MIVPAWLEKMTRYRAGCVTIRSALGTRHSALGNSAKQRGFDKDE
jgi:hypothetical protein